MEQRQCGQVKLWQRPSRLGLPSGLRWWSRGQRAWGILAGCVWGRSSCSVTKHPTVCAVAAKRDEKNGRGPPSTAASRPPIAPAPPHL